RPRRARGWLSAWLGALVPDTPSRRLHRIVRSSKARTPRQARPWSPTARRIARLRRLLRHCSRVDPIVPVSQILCLIGAAALLRRVRLSVPVTLIIAGTTAVLAGACVDWVLARRRAVRAGSAPQLKTAMNDLASRPPEPP